ncbi:Ig domain-containing protein [uncultured Paludibaculum sp.]|uniref:Ig domain-containing protein n=1 Tax=uncultured Paludibaculum sp. TaxID=1765020 RepID=UPI002AABAA3E|nr:Ig domain-containing protein [uncultured Paludibaculum sp.]
MHILLLALALTTGSPDWNQPSVGRPWSMALKAEGGTAPYQWAVLEGALPPGVYFVDLSTVMLGSASVPGFYGAPAEAGQWSVRVQATDAEGQTAERWVELTVSPLRLQQAYIVAPVGQAMEWQAAVTEGAAPFEFRLAPHGYLPLGLTLTQAGVLRGTVLVSGIYEIPIEIVDAGGNRLQTTLTVNAYGEESSLPAFGVRLSVQECHVVAQFPEMPETIKGELFGGGPGEPVDVALTNLDSGEQVVAHYEDQSLSLDSSCEASPSILSLGRALGL